MNAPNLASGPGQIGRLRCEIVTDIHDLTVTELAAAIRQGELSPVQITAHYLDRTERMNADVGAFFTITAERAAQLVERELLQLVFLPGFSTAAAVTNVSGRGVGMDVVKTNVEKIGGKSGHYRA